MRRTAFTLFLGLLGACGAGFGSLAALGRILPVEVASSSLQFESLSIGTLFLLWGILQLALEEKSDKAPEQSPPRPAPREESIPSILELRAARLNGKKADRGLAHGDGAIAPPDSRWN